MKDKQVNWVLLGLGFLSICTALAMINSKFEFSVFVFIGMIVLGICLMVESFEEFEEKKLLLKRR